MPFGRPVVPEENSTHSGASNGTRSNRSSAGVAVASCQGTPPVGPRHPPSPAGRSGRPGWGTRTVARSVGSALCQRGDLAPAVDDPAVPPVAVGGDEHHRLELGEACGRTLGRVVLPAGGPDRADAGAGEEGDQGRGAVGQVADDPVTGLHPRRAQPSGEGGDLGAQLGPRRRGRGAVLIDRGDRHGVRPARLRAGAQRVLGVVEPGPGEPAGAGHAGVRQDGVRCAVGGDVEEVPDGRPELLQVLDRPGPQVGIGAERAPGPGAHLGGEPGDRRIRDAVGIRGPDGLGGVAVRHLGGQALTVMALSSR